MDEPGAEPKKKPKNRYMGSMLGKKAEDHEEEVESEDEEEEEPSWKKERHFLEGTLEEALKNNSPFETYALSLGSKYGTILSEPDFASRRRSRVSCASLKAGSEPGRCST